MWLFDDYYTLWLVWVWVCLVGYCCILFELWVCFGFVCMGVCAGKVCFCVDERSLCWVFDGVVVLFCTSSLFSLFYWLLTWLIVWLMLWRLEYWLFNSVAWFTLVFCVFYDLLNLFEGVYVEFLFVLLLCWVFCCLRFGCCGLFGLLIVGYLIVGVYLFVCLCWVNDLGLLILLGFNSVACIRYLLVIVFDFGVCLGCFVVVCLFVVGWWFLVVGVF